MAAQFPRRVLPPMLPADSALFLDVDGTLLEFALRPDAVALPAGAIDLLQRLHQRLDGALALVSGRALHELDRLFAPLQLPAAGLHGQQFRGAPTPPRAEPHLAMQKLREEAQRLSQAYPGVLVEDKGRNVALHWRAAPSAAPAVRALAEAHMPQLHGYRLQPGDHVLELVPADVDKGRAVQLLMQQPPFAGRRPVFVGDDLTDEYGFAAANTLGGWSVLVGHRSNSHAIYHLPDIAAVYDWLRANASEETA